MLQYWWVNQNQTFRFEFDGGYIWSPKQNKGGGRNQFYENMRDVAPSDLIFSFRDTKIIAIGRALTYCYSSPKPEEFGDVGSYWESNGWKVNIEYKKIDEPIRPKDFIDQISPLLPAKYSPLQSNGNGLQSVYLASVPHPLADLLLNLIKTAGNNITIEDGHLPDIIAGKEAVRSINKKQESAIKASSLLSETEKKSLVDSRRGQGKFRRNVQSFEKCCRVTGVSDPYYLIASHIKPWRESNNLERIDGENGLMLTPNIDFLFGDGLISFADDGTLIIAPRCDNRLLQTLGIMVQTPINVGPFTSNQKKFLKYHREEVFKYGQKTI